MLVIAVQGSFEEAKRSIQEGQKVGDIIELRIDLLEKNDLVHISKLKNLSKIPVIFTLRKKKQGGAFPGNTHDQEVKLLELLTLKPDYVDIEYDCPFADKIDSNISVIASYHNFEKTPEDLETVLNQMNRFPAQIKKIATMAHSSIDALRMLNFVQKHQIVGICMGERGGITRILGPIVGTPLTYSFVGKKAAPGQISSEELIKFYSFHALNRNTKIYGLIGDPVDQSKGDRFYNQYFNQSSLAVYVKCVVTPVEIPQFFREISSLPFWGLSVTMPLKEQVAPYLNKVTPEAKACGAVNTLVRKGDQWIGTNTDGIGAIKALEKKGSLQGKILLIIGAGGAAKAIAYCAAQRGAKIIIANRTQQKGEILAKKVGGMATSLGDLPNYDILINTTSVGMYPHTDALPIAEKEIQEKKMIFDIISNPKETKLLNIGRAKGGILIYGQEMFIEQALMQLQEWGWNINRKLRLLLGLFDGCPTKWLGEFPPLIS